jgi:hypothetical protein
MKLYFQLNIINVRKKRVKTHEIPHYHGLNNYKTPKLNVVI